MTATAELSPDRAASPQAAAAGAAGSSFYLAMRILPRRRREAMYAVYGFCRAVDDIADGTTDAPERRLAALERWRSAIDALYAGTGAEPLPGLAVAIRDFGLAREDFHAVIDGMAMDIPSERPPFDWAELDLYCDRVASAVGRLSVRIFGVDGDHGPGLAHHLGRALQLTNILRDLDEDAGLGRLYLPREALDAAGITDFRAAAVLADPRLDIACRAVADRAKSHFAAAAAIMAASRRRAVRAPRLMASAYAPVLDRMTARGWAPPRVRIGVDKRRLVLAVLRYGLV